VARWKRRIEVDMTHNNLLLSASRDIFGAQGAFATSLMAERKELLVRIDRLDKRADMAEQGNEDCRNRLIDCKRENAEMAMRVSVMERELTDLRNNRDGW